MKHDQVPFIPRTRAWLQFEAVPRSDGQDGFQVDYELVLPLGEVDCRGTFDQNPARKRPASHRTVWLDSDNCRRIPMGRTMVGTDARDFPFHTFNGETSLDLPFRDGAHCGWDNDLLGLEIYYKTAGKIYHLIPAEKT